MASLFLFFLFRHLGRLGIVEKATAESIGKCRQVPQSFLLVVAIKLQSV